MAAVIFRARGPARAEDEEREEAEDEVRGEDQVRYRTSITLRTTSFAAPGRLCTRVSTSLNACDSPPCLKHSAQRGSFVKSRRANAPCIMASRSPSTISRSDGVFRSTVTPSPCASEQY